MKVLLAYMSGRPDRQDPYVSLLPNGLCSLHACLKEAGFDTVLANYSGWTPAAIRRHVAAVKPDLAGISQWTHNRHASIELAQIFRAERPGCVIVMGGAHATCCYADVLRRGGSVDAVVLGEGEETLIELAHRVKEGRRWSDVSGIACIERGEMVITPSRRPIRDLDALPSAAACLEDSVGIDIALQAEFIITARGCPAACHFCCSPRLWNRRTRFRSPAAIVDEMIRIRDRYGLIYFSLRDDTFTADRPRAIEICRLLIERRAYLLWNCQSRVNALDEELLVWMKRAGCECVQLGVESGSPRILSLLGKTITPDQVEQAAALVRKVGISLSVYLISDVPGETGDDIRLTVELIRRIHPDDGYVSPLAYYPGTRLFEEAVAAGGVERDIFMTCHDAAVYAVGKPGRNSRLLVKALTSAAPRDRSRFRRQKDLLGYCYTTNILAGEHFRQLGDSHGAEREFMEIVEREPENPWGWYLLGELYGELGDRGQALDCFRAVCGIVPQHGPSREALTSKKKRGHEGPALNCKRQ